jgi:mono/diheme cytochrome c family protein
MDSAPSPSRSTPLTVKIGYAQLILAVLAFATVPIYALKKSGAGDASAAEARIAATDDSDTEAAPATAAASADPITRGEALFAQSCAACHQPNGEGLPGAFPPLAKSDYLLADPDRAVGVVLRGLIGPVTVNGVHYESAMPPMSLDDTDTAAVLTYVFQAWGNQGPNIGPEDVSRIRAAGAPGS